MSKTTRRPELEQLEDRLTPATHVWTGGATLSNNWTNDNNWNIGAPNSPDDVLVFPTNVAKKTADNNFADGTSFKSIIIQGDGYTLKGNRLVLGAGGITAGGQGGIGSEIKLDLSLPETRTINVGALDRFEIRGTVSGSGGIAKTGSGTLALYSNNFYSGLTTVLQGNLEAEKAAALGSTQAGTVVHAFADLRILGPASVGELTLLEPLTLNGLSELRTVGRVDLAGEIQLIGPSVLISGQPGSGNRLIISGAMSGAGGWTLVGEARLEGTTANTYAGTTQVGDGILGGKLFLNKPDGITAIPGSLLIGDVSAGSASSEVVLQSHSQIDDDSDLFVRRNSALDLAGFFDSIGSLQLSSGRVESSAFFDNALGLAGPVSATSLDASVPSLIAVPLFLGTDTRTIVVNDGPAVLDLVISGQIFGSGGLLKEGSGTAVLNADNVYTGLTTINAGVLEVDGKQPNSGVIVNGGTLAGNGTIGALTVEAGAKVSPGTPTDPTAILRVDGDARLNPGAIIEVDVDGTLAGSGHDQLSVHRSGTLNPVITHIEGVILSPIVGPSSRPGRDFRIIESDIILGEFADLPDEATFTTASGVRLSVDYRAPLLSTNYLVVLTHENTSTKVEDLKVTADVIPEDETVTVTGILTDPDLLDKLTLQIDWGDGSRDHVSHPGRDPFAVPHRYRDDGTYTIHVTWFDEHGEGNSRDLVVTVHNVAPQVFAGGPATLLNNGVLIRLGAFVDPGRDQWTGTTDYGDGSGVQSLRVHKGFFLLHHHYRQSGTYTVTVTITDDDGGVGTNTFEVTVREKPGKPSEILKQHLELDALFALLGIEQGTDD